jgi:hypothetical protein
MTHDIERDGFTSDEFIDKNAALPLVQDKKVEK